jgi:hypothetical protein
MILDHTLWFWLAAFQESKKTSRLEAPCCFGRAFLASFPFQPQKTSGNVSHTGKNLGTQTSES